MVQENSIMVGLKVDITKSKILTINERQGMYTQITIQDLALEEHFTYFGNGVRETGGTEENMTMNNAIGMYAIANNCVPHR